MTSFVLETFVPGGSRDHFTGDVAGLRRAAGTADAGGAVRHLGSYLVPGDEMAFHLVDASDIRDVERVAGEAGVEAERIVEAVTGGPE